MRKYKISYLFVLLMQALAEGRPWRDPPVVKETLGGGSQAGKPPTGLNGRSSVKNNGGWDDWDDDFRSPSDIRRNQSAGDFRAANGGGSSGGQPSRSRSTADIYSRSELEASAANKGSFFERKMAENESKPEGIPPSQGGKYVGFGSSPAPTSRSNSRNNPQGDVLRDTVSVVSQVIICLAFNSVHCDWFYWLYR